MTKLIKGWGEITSLIIYRNNEKCFPVDTSMTMHFTEIILAVSFFVASGINPSDTSLAKSIFINFNVLLGNGVWKLASDPDGPQSYTVLFRFLPDHPSYLFIYLFTTMIYLFDKFLYIILFNKFIYIIIFIFYHL